MNYTKHDALNSLKPTHKWTWAGYNYADLVWDDSDVKPTEAEIDAELTKLNNAEPMKLLREKRNEKLAESDWTILSDSQLTTTKQNEWKTYRQALRDLPASANPKIEADSGVLDPSSYTLPTEPS
jgi:hypothetical protein